MSLDMCRWHVVTLNGEKYSRRMTHFVVSILHAHSVLKHLKCLMQGRMLDLLNANAGRTEGG